MGFFSWKTQDTDESIPNKYQNIMPVFTVYMRDNKGNVWEEKNYEGYGEFGGKDFYVLLAEMNGIEGTDQEKRHEGITLWGFSNDSYISPNLNRNKDTPWDNTYPVDCEYQGFFYPEDEEED